MASITKLKSGNWRARIRKNGRPLSATFRTKAEAVAWSAKVEADASLLRAGEIPNKTFGDLLKRTFYLEQSERESSFLKCMGKKLIPQPEQQTLLAA